MAYAHANVSPVWPPTGVALTALLWLGYRVSPGVLLGALLANLATEVSLITAIGIAVGNTLEATAAAFLIRRLIGLRSPFDQAQDVLKFIVIAGMLSTTVSATIGSMSLCISGAASWSSFKPLWLTWWLGDGVGALVVAPLLLTWIEKRYKNWLNQRILEAAVLLISLCAVAAIIFLEGTNYPLEHLTVPFLLWAAFRFGQRGAATAILILSAIAVWGTTRGLGPFARENLNESLLLLQIFIAAVTVTSLVLAAVVTERKRAEEEHERLFIREKAARKEAEQAQKLSVELLQREQVARAEAEVANRAKDQFLATISHELRTPLNAILGWAGMLRNGRLDKATTAQALEIIERNAIAQTQLINDILDISRIVPGKLRLEVRPVELSSIVRAAIDVIRPAADAKEITLQVTLDTGAGPVSGDPDRLQQIVWNLLSNAVKFTPRGGRVDVRLERQGSQLEITVSDTGIGINADFLPHVFDSFRQADSSYTRAHGGLGLGLAIVRQLVELHGGTVEALSRGDGEGAAFKVRLPLISLNPVPGSKSRDSLSPGSDFSRRSSLQGLRLLVVDDDGDARSLLNLMLEECGAIVTTAATAAEAFDLLEQVKPDLLISDIEMPNEDGFSLIRKIRSLDAKLGAPIPCVALTAHAKSEDRIQVLSAGFQAHVAKPVAANELINVMASLIGRSDRV
jgi:signal transduction histidine kinase/ActR/RegA family two-component response regulator